MKKKIRLPLEVLREIAEEIPEEMKFRTPEFDRLVEYVFFQPPESKIAWTLVSVFVNKIVSHPPQEEWEWKVVSILTAKTVDELKKEEKERAEKNARKKKTY